MYLLPKPQKYTLFDGVYIIGYNRSIVIDALCSTEAFAYAEELNKDLQQYAGYTLAVTKGKSRKAAITLAQDNQLHREAYTLEAGEEGIVITGGSMAGLFYGVQTLRQIIQQEGACIPYMYIEDFPSIPARGLYYDVTRGRVPTLAYLKKLVDKMAFYKLNQLQLYIEHSFLFEDFSEVWRDDTPLTAADILELDAYCRNKNIDLVPSIASFGHLYKVLRTKSFCHLCELPNTQEEPFGFIDRMEHHTLDVSNPESLQFVTKLIDEYLPLFTSEYFNICADETFDLGKGRSKTLAEQKGVEQMYLDFVKQLCRYLVDKGKKPMFWGDIICGFPQAAKELPKETICLNWGYAWNQTDASVRKLAEAGAVQYCCPAVCGWDQFVNRIGDSYENIRRMCTYALQYDAAGVLITDWGDCGHINHPDFGIVGMVYGAAFSWNHTDIYKGKLAADRADHTHSQFEEMNRQISRLAFHDKSESLVSAIAEIAEYGVFQWRDAVCFMERGEITIAEEDIAQAQQEINALEKIKVRLYHTVPQIGVENRMLIEPYIMAVDGIILMQKIGIALWMQKHHNTSGQDINYDELAAQLEEWMYIYKKEWRKVSRESELYRIQNVVFWYADYLRKCG